MTNNTPTPACEPAPEPPPMRGVVQRARLDTEGGGQHIAVQHATRPFEDDVRVGHEFEDLLELAVAYLGRVGAELGLDPELRSHLGDARAGTSFGWLAAPGTPHVERRGSFSVRRAWPDEAQCIDETFVVLAGWAERDKDGDVPLPLGGATGLRLVAHVAAPDALNPTVRHARFTSATASRLDDAKSLAPSESMAALVLRAAHAASGAAPMTAKAAQAVQKGDDGAPQGGLDPLLKILLPIVAKLWSLQPPLTLDNVARITAGAEDFYIAGTGQRSSATVRWAANLSARGELRAVRSVDLVSAATAQGASVFHRDPASAGPPAGFNQRRPGIEDDRLNMWRKPTAIVPTGTALSSAGRFDVRSSPVPYPQAADTAIKLAADSTNLLRNDELAAAHAYLRAHEFFERFDAHALPLAGLFREAVLPLKLTPRAQLRRAADGRRVNAEVRAEADAAVVAINPRMRLQMRFGAANLVQRKAYQRGDRTTAEPLGLAADPRWAWHEFGHVLACAATGNLEFRFAHSVGDAMAVVVSDPQSALCADDGAPPNFLEGLSFPFALTRRRHDRDAGMGWCWCGRRSTLRRDALTRSMLFHSGYFEEQLLSSSLFRLYRCLGGATRVSARPDESLAARQSASDYVVYLVLRACSLLPPDRVVPTATIDEFVGALIDADIGTALWSGTARWPEEGAARPFRRLGGRVHKVVQWAFEQQGMGAAPDAASVVEGAGALPPVDVFIAARGRPNGGYDAVPLLWSNSHEPWHASAIEAIPAGLRVRVGNRGLNTANGVTVRAWCADTSGGSGPLAWVPLTAMPGGANPVTPGGVTPFAFAASVACSAPYWVLAEARCADDPSNLDSSTGLPFADDQPPKELADVIELVANDNNFGLALIEP